MAEFPELGTQCAKPDCKQLDFLPFKCSHCDSIFCQNHFPSIQHNCKRFDNITEKDGATADSWLCGVEECERRDALELACPACHVHFCLAHRHAPDHSCPSLEGLEEQECKRRAKFEAPTREFKQAKEALDKQLNTQLRSAKNKERAAKVQLMRLKSRATLAKQGLNIAVSERVFFLIKAPEKVGGDSVLVTSSAWSLGRVLDAAAEACGVKNTNNLPNSPQLRLFHDDKSPVASHEMHHTILYLMTQHLLHDGQTLILEYI